MLIRRKIPSYDNGWKWNVWRQGRGEWRAVGGGRRDLLQSRRQLVTFNFQFCGSGAKGFVVAFVRLLWRQWINVISDVLMHNLIPPERVLNRRQTINNNKNNNRSNTKGANRENGTTTMATMLLWGSCVHGFNPFAMTCKILITSRFVKYYENFLRVGIMTSLLKRNLFIERARC